eukprot:jgi/Tetstr1/431891/TSEL_021380.t1
MMTLSKAHLPVAVAVLVAVAVAVQVPVVVAVAVAVDEDSRPSSKIMITVATSRPLMILLRGPRHQVISLPPEMWARIRKKAASGNRNLVHPAEKFWGSDQSDFHEWLERWTVSRV